MCSSAASSSVTPRWARLPYNRGKVGGIYDSHYTYAIRTFWIGCLYSLISLVLTFLFMAF